MNIRNDLLAIPLPPIYKRNGLECFLDPYREKLIPLTPEEIVRQRVASWLEQALKIPNHVILLEQHLSHYGIKSRDRADIVIHRETKDGMLPIAVIECKADTVFLSDATIQQGVRYANAMECNYFLVTNGVDLLIYQYDEKDAKYFELTCAPSYEDMLQGKGSGALPPVPIDRPSLEQLNDETIQQRYLDERIIGSATKKELRPYIINLFECLMDTTRNLPIITTTAFSMIQDYGVRMLSYGNAAGYTYFAPYRSFLICDSDGNHQFVSIGFNAYGNDKTILCVAIDDYKKSHHALQLLVDTYMDIQNEVAVFWHSGRIAVGHQGSGKASDLKQLITIKSPSLIKNEKIYLGEIELKKLLYLDDSDVCNFIYNIVNYALLRDEYRNHLKKK